MCFVFLVTEMNLLLVWCYYVSLFYQEEAKELEEFELLEDIADNMSLVSNSSVVARLITPNKQKQRVGTGIVQDT